MLVRVKYLGCTDSRPFRTKVMFGKNDFCKLSLTESKDYELDATEQTIALIRKLIIKRSPESVRDQLTITFVGVYDRDEEIYQVLFNSGW